MTPAEFERWYRQRYRRTSSLLLSLFFIIADFLGVMLSFGNGFFWVNLYDMDAINFKSFVTYWPYLPVFILLFHAMRLYPGVALAPAEELRSFSIASLIGHGSIIFSRYIENHEFNAISAAFVVSFCFSSLIFLLCRDLARSLVRRAGVKGIPAVIFGTGAFGEAVVDRLLSGGKVGYAPVVILDAAAPPDTRDYRSIPVLRDPQAGPWLVKTFNIKMAIVAMPQLTPEELARLVNSISAFRYNVLIPNSATLNNIWMSVRDFDGLLGLSSVQMLKMPWNRAVKRSMDFGITLLGGLVLLPLLLFIALLVKLSSPGPVLYGHPRLGQNGRRFKAWKFRSMRVNADAELEAVLAADPAMRAEWEASRKLKHDPRVTGIGKILRRTSFDEFPQLLNILAGEMSLVGPRPVVEEEVQKYGEDFGRIFSTKPGLTGLWQVSGRSDTDYAERVSYDTYYLQSWSLWLDLWVLYRTPGTIIHGRGAY